MRVQWGNTFKVLVCSPYRDHSRSVRAYYRNEYIYQQDFPKRKDCMSSQSVWNFRTQDLKPDLLSRGHSLKPFVFQDERDNTAAKGWSPKSSKSQSCEKQTRFVWGRLCSSGKKIGEVRESTVHILQPYKGLPKRTCVCKCVSVHVCAPCIHLCVHVHAREELPKLWYPMKQQTGCKQAGLGKPRDEQGKASSTFSVL